MRILAILYCFPPLLVPAAVRYLKVVLGLRELGVDVEVVVIDPRSFHAPGARLDDPDLASLVPDDLRRHVVRSPETHPLVLLAKRIPAARKALYRVFEPKKAEWLIPSRRTLRRLDLSRYDALLSCSQPHANHLLGLELKERSGLPWVAWFGDPWSQNPYARFASDRIREYNSTLEARVLSGADFVFYTSEEMLHLAELAHPHLLEGKAGVLPHLFVPEWYGRSSAVAQRRASLEILHTGHFYGARSPRLVLEALSRLNRTAPLAGKLRIVSHGSMGDADRASVHVLGLGEVFVVRPMVPYLDSLALMRQADALLLVDAPLTITEESVFLPSKLVDYLGSGKPVAAVTPIAGASSRAVTDAGGTVCDVTDPEGIESLFQRMLSGELPPPPSPDVISRYHYRAVADHLLKRLEQVAGKHRSARPSPVLAGV